MEEELLLSQLCKICNINAPKYVCPGCNTRTCSLICYKRHQKWSDCSGKRNPASFMKRSQLASAAGIDHDFNFLSGVERALESADRNAESRGVNLKETRPTRYQGEASLAGHLRKQGIFIHNAPKGMTRSKQNNTRITKSKKHVLWTVEWISPDGTRQIRDCLDNVTLSDAYHCTDEAGRTAKRRKTNQPKVEMHSDVPQENEQADEEISPASKHVQAENHIESVARSMQDQAQTHEYFYLVKAFTSSSSCVLIPLSPDATLSSCLKNQTILEFPAIQILKEPPQSLIDGFILDTKYAEQREKLLREVDEVLGDLPVKSESESAKAPGNVKHEEERLSRDKLLETLRRDIDGIRK